MSLTEEPATLARENAALRARVAELEAALERTRDALEDAEDEAALLRGALDRARNGLAGYRPAAVADAVAAGDTPLRAWRKHRGFTTAAAFADAADLSANYVTRLERGEPLPAALRDRLATFLDIPPDALRPETDRA